MKQQESTGNGFIDLGTEIFSIGQPETSATIREDRLRRTGAFVAFLGLASVLGIGAAWGVQKADAAFDQVYERVVSTR
jgi:hypothetical protein